jgi:hypothetical protein
LNSAFPINGTHRPFRQAGMTVFAAPVPRHAWVAYPATTGT